MFSCKNDQMNRRQEFISPPTLELKVYLLFFLTLIEIL